MIKITIKTDNEAFSWRSYEVARILEELADRIKNSAGEYNEICLMDSNGNNVGKYIDTEE